jgi:RING finger family protein
MLEQRTSIKKKLFEYEDALRRVKERQVVLEEANKRQKLEVIEKGARPPTESVQEDPKTGSRAFWRPEQTPHAVDLEPEKPDTSVLCHGASEAHPISLKSLIDVKIHVKDGEASCPSCLKGLKLVKSVHVLRPCGHTLCKDCLEQRDEKCFTCDTPIECHTRMVGEGTGYASAGGNVQVKRYQHAFQ